MAIGRNKKTWNADLHMKEQKESSGMGERVESVNESFPFER